MITDKLSIFNLALNAAGARSNLGSVDENTREAETCRLWYSVVVDQVLGAAHWASARGYARLALLVERDDTVAWEPTDPAPGYRYMYAGPSDMLMPRFISTYDRFEMGVYDAQRVLYCNVETPVLVYTKRNEMIGSWSPGLQMSVVYALAGHIGMPLHAKPGRVKLALEQANDLILQARADEANSQDAINETLPEWITARGYASPAEVTRYVYPYGSLFSTGAPDVR